MNTQQEIPQAFAETCEGTLIKPPPPPLPGDGGPAKASATEG